MPSTVEKLSTTRVKITIEVPFSDLEPAIKKAYRELANQVAIPGFRKGHVPPSMIDLRLGRGAVLSEAVNAVLPDIWANAVQEHGLTLLGHPDIDMTSLEDGQSAEFTGEVDVAPDFDLPDFETISVTVEPVGDVDTLVDERIDTLRQRFAEVSEVDREAQVGDQVRIDLSGSQNGTPMPDATAQSLTYVVGSGDMLDGLDEAVIGCVAGDTREFSSTLLGGGHAGEAADITVTVTQVFKRTLPDVDDSFAQLVSQFDTVEEMREDLAKGVERAAVMGQVSAARNQVLDAAIEMAGIDVPAGLVAEEVAARVAQITDQLRSSGMSLEDYLAAAGDPDTSTPEQFEAATKTSVERGIRAEILLSRVADEEKVVADQEDLTNFIFAKAQENGTTPEQEVAHMQSHNHLPEWMSSIRQSKALAAMVAKASVVDTDGKPVSLAAI